MSDGHMDTSTLIMPIRQPVEEDRTTLALATSARHPGLAMAIAAANFPQQKTLVAGAVVIYLILRLIL
jgi:bile acid:Na+ symporter, BASS family